jgi:hypothetical protein
MDEIPRCPFCKVRPVKSKGASANIYLIPHKDGCLLKTFFNKIQDGQVEKWMKLGE